MKVAMMQPYLFPYLGYFQLISAVDIFIFADDVNFIKGGFINRNKILVNGEEKYFTVPCHKSQNKLINETQVSRVSKGYAETILLTIQHAYSKAPFFTDVFPLLKSVFRTEVKDISKLAVISVEKVSKYLGIEVDFQNSSTSFGHTKGQEKSTRLINITRELGGSTYRNPIGGAKIYDKQYFSDHGIQLEFLVPEAIIYPQFDANFVPNLSIIDVIMFNSKEDVNNLLNKYRLR